TKAQSVQTDLYLPVNAQNHRWSYGGKAERSDLNGLLSRTGSAYMRRGEIIGDIERQIGLVYVYEHRDISGDGTELGRALAAEYSWTIRRTAPPLYPDRGYQVNWQLSAASHALASTDDFVRAYIRGITLLPVTEDSTITLRGETGTVFAR